MSKSISTSSAVLGAISLIAVSLSPAIAQGSLQFEGKIIKLNKVLAVHQGDEEGLGNGPHLRILLTDGEIPMHMARRATLLHASAYARQNKINGVVLETDVAGTNQAAEAHLLYAPGFAPEAFASTKSSQAFSHIQIANGRIIGKASLKGKTFSIDAEIDAPIVANAISADLAGKKAASSPQAKAVIAFSDALKKGNLEAVGKVATATRLKKLQDIQTQLGIAGFREAMADEPDGKTLAQSIVRVIVRDDMASVIMSDKQVQALVLENNLWKVE